jgi:hypothetical protein
MTLEGDAQWGEERIPVPARLSGEEADSAAQTVTL